MLLLWKDTFFLASSCYCPGGQPNLHVNLTANLNWLKTTYFLWHKSKVFHWCWVCLVEKLLLRHPWCQMGSWTGQATQGASPWFTYTHTHLHTYIPGLQWHVVCGVCHLALILVHAHTNSLVSSRSKQHWSLSMWLIVLPLSLHFLFLCFHWQ